MANKPGQALRRARTEAEGLKGAYEHERKRREAAERERDEALARISDYAVPSFQSRHYSPGELHRALDDRERLTATLAAVREIVVADWTWDARPRLLALLAGEGEK